MPKLTQGKWSILYDSCINCKAKEFKHEAKGYCKKCYANIFMKDKIVAWTKEYRKNNKQKNYRKSTRTGFLYSDAPRPRANVCEICSREGRTVLDHSHVTGKFRGWLCNQCNTSLGMVKDNIEILNKMILYLIKNS